jgi:MFS family permease
MRRLLAYRDARLYLSGQIMSLFGDSALWLAMGIWIKDLTGSSAAAGLSFFALTLGSLCGPLGGMLADRVRRRPLLITANLATAGLVLLLLLVRDRHQVWLIYTIMFGYGVSGPAPVIIGDAATFLVAVATLLAIAISERRPAPSGQRWLAELTAGARYIARTVVLRQLTIAATAVVTAYGISETVMFAVVSQGLHRPTSFLGILVSAQGVGAVAAGVVAAPLMRRLSEGLLAGLGMISAALAFLLLTAPQLAIVFAGCALLGVSLSWIIIGIMTLFQRRTPPELMGRADAAFTVAYAVPQTVSIALGAGLITVLSYRILLLATAALMTLAAGYLLTRREQHRGYRRAASKARPTSVASGPLVNRPMFPSPDETGSANQA